MLIRHAGRAVARPRSCSAADNVGVARDLGRLNASGPQRLEVALHLTTEFVDRPKHDDVVAVCELLDRTDRPTIGRKFLAEGTEQRAPALGTRDRLSKLARDPTRTGLLGRTGARCGVHAVSLVLDWARESSPAAVAGASAPTPITGADRPWVPLRTKPAISSPKPTTTFVSAAHCATSLAGKQRSLAVAAPIHRRKGRVRLRSVTPPH